MVEAIKKCVICQGKAPSICSRCRQVAYCGIEHQRQDWATHKKTCGKQQPKQQTAPVQQAPIGNPSMIDDNLQSQESVGTFRWNDSIELLAAPAWQPEFQLLLRDLELGWKGYVNVRFEGTAVGDTINLQPHQLDGLSFPMTLILQIKKHDLWRQKKLNIVVMGGSAKAEERLFCSTNYFEELTNFFPQHTFKFYFAGPEQSAQRSDKTVIKNERLSGFFYRATVGEFLLDNYESEEEIKQKLPLENTIFIGFNPGFGCGYEALLRSWSRDLLMLFNLGYKVIFTCANDYSDLRGETAVFQEVFQGRVKYFMDGCENPFRAVTHYTKDGRKEGNWSCGQTHCYGLEGWKEGVQPLTWREIKEFFKTQESEMLLQSCMVFATKGAPAE